MNELLKDLEKRSVFFNEEDSVFEFDREKFAELIVKECAGVGYDASYYECALNVSNKIKEHFGVEE